MNEQEAKRARAQKDKETERVRGSFSPASTDSDSGRALQGILAKHSIANSQPGSPLFSDLMDLFTLGAGGARR